jgi:pyrroline-5-carboxylate reductase
VKPRPIATVFLGGGRITRALLAGLRLAGYKSPLIVHDRSPDKLRKLKQQYGMITETELHHAVAQARILIIAVRPGSVYSLLQEIGHVARPLNAVSLAAGIPLANLRKWLPAPVHWARAMPSPVARSGNGLTALAFDRTFSPSARRDVQALFSQVGSVLEIPEKQFDAFTVTYSSSHGYHALAVLAEAAQEIGLDRRTAFIAAAHGLADGIAAWRQGRIPLDHLLQEAATPGGISAAAMAAMKAAGYYRTIARGLKAGVARARKNARG